MRRQRRSPALLSAARPLPGPALTGPWPTVTRSQGARHAAPPSLPRATARSHRAPSPEYRPAAARTHWARLVRIAPIACRRAHRPPHHDHRAPPPSYTCCASPSASRPPCAPTASRKQAEQHKQLNAGIKIGSPNGDPIEELFGFAQRLPDALQSLHQANELALSYLDHSTRQRLGGYVIGLSGNSFTVDLYAALVDHATSIAR